MLVVKFLFNLVFAEILPLFFAVGCTYGIFNSQMLNSNSMLPILALIGWIAVFFVGMMEFDNYKADRDKPKYDKMIKDGLERYEQLKKQWQREELYEKGR